MAANLKGTIMQKITSLTLALALTGLAVRAAEPPNPLSFADGKLVLDVQERLRVESRTDNFDFNDGAKHVTDDTFVLQRLRLGVKVTPVNWLKGYAQAQDSRQWGAKRPAVPFAFGSEGDDPLDLRQANIEIGDPRQFPVTLNLGRQELSYGDERLVGAFDWNNFARTFDALKLRWASADKRWWVEAFVGHVVNIRNAGPDENDDLHLNRADWSDTLAGLYVSTTAFNKQTTDAYLFYRNKRDNNPTYTGISGTTTNRALAYDGAQEVWTPGFRIKSLPGQWHGWDYELEASLQLGASGTQRLDHVAFAIHAGAGYTWEKLAWKPRLGLEYNVASGDDDPTDGASESFLNLFPTNHKFYGYLDVFAWKNMHNVAGSLKLKPYQDARRPYHNLALQLDGHLFWLYTNDDAWYRANAVTAVRTLNAAARSANPFAGGEVDLTVTYGTPWRWVKLQAGYSHFFAGDYLRHTGAGNDADFGYVQTTISF